MIVRRQEHENFTFRTRVDVEELGAGAAGGLVVLANEDFHARLMVEAGEPAHLVLIRRESATEEELVRIEAPARALVLEFAAVGQDYRAGFELDDGSARTLACFDGRFLSTEIAGGFTGVMIGPYAVCPVGADGGHLEVHWVEYAGGDRAADGRLVAI
jgi:xylan 1,4-beta-xylosidase